MSRQAFVQAITYADEPSGNLKIANSAEVSVFNAGTETLAKLYEERTGGALVGNPFILGATALADFWVDSGDYDIKVHDTKGPARFGDFVFGWQSSPVNPSIAEGDLSNSGDIEWTQELSGAWVPQLKANSVGANEILTGGVGSLELSDGSVISSKFKPISGVKYGTVAVLPFGAAWEDAGVEFEFTPTVAATRLIVRMNALAVCPAGCFVEFTINMDGVDNAKVARYGGSAAQRGMVTQSWEVTGLSAAKHTVKLRQRRTSGAGGESAPDVSNLDYMVSL